MNPGGLRQDMLGNPGGYPATLTYKQAADVQSFANTLVNMDLTGAQIKATLEQQWQPAGAARPFLRLGASKGFTYTYDPSRAPAPASPRCGSTARRSTCGDDVSVTVNSFLATGGDAFTALNGGTNKQDTGKVDLQAMVDYMDEFANPDEGDPPLPVSFAQQAVGVKFPGGAPASSPAGTSHVTFDLTSLSMTAPSDTRDATVNVSLGGTVLGTFPVHHEPECPAATSTATTRPALLRSTSCSRRATPAGMANLVVSGATGTSVPGTGDGDRGASAPPPVSTTVSGSAPSFPYGKAGTLHHPGEPAHR